MALSDIRVKIDNALAEITGLNHSVSVPSVPNPPFAFPALRPSEPMTYDFTAGNATAVYHFYIEVLVNKGATIEQAQDDMDGYLMPWGDKSIKVAVEAILWGDFADVCRVTGITNYGPAMYGGTEFMGARVALDIWVTSTD
jgi:hypothetical protein